MEKFRVWCDGTCQSYENSDSYSWMSDDYITIEANDEAEAVEIAILQGFV